ncbi:serine/threonine-protein kinase [Streptomyces sp. BA2]|uniref:serine/threonine-protein kinase n=1 Tax=Streptomyces sp. BA2 TaxID=436595 RepID=UPI0013285A64|nr:serine/threonine-protein kinase [Streptomyces sp. BA2]MWA10537.1 protein kinase [Streptomyces sp. BA2]
MSGQGDVVDGRFELLERLGSGGMGTVWRARDTVLHREVAVKEVRPAGRELTDEESRVLRERVLREARALARLNHPHVVTIHHIVDTDPHPWLVMELLPGRTLQDLLEQGTLPPHEAARIGRELLSALRVAHAAGILHRDVKPANVLLRDEAPGTGVSVVLTDFGIASLRGSTQLTATGDLIGSPEFIAPERIRGTDEGPAADLWSLGLVLYVAVEGVSPLRRSSTLATLAAVLDDPVPPPVRSGPLAPVLSALLVRDPALRPDAERLDAMLAAVANGIAWQPTETSERPAVTVGPPVTVGSPSAEPRRRTPVMVAVIAVALAMVAGAALVLALRGGGGTDGEESKNPTQSESPTRSKSPTQRKSPTQSKSPTRSESPDPTTPSASPSASTSASASASATPPASGSWIAQLFSEPVGTGAGARDRRLAAVRKDVPEAQYLRSDDYASLRPGFWVIYAPGPFADGRAALRFCEERGRTTGNECVGRYLSSSGGDYGLQCKPPASAPVGRCTRA